MSDFNKDFENKESEVENPEEVKAEAAEKEDSPVKPVETKDVDAVEHASEVPIEESPVAEDVPTTEGAPQEDDKANAFETEIPPEQVPPENIPVAVPSNGNNTAIKTYSNWGGILGIVLIFVCLIALFAGITNQSSGGSEKSELSKIPSSGIIVDKDKDNDGQKYTTPAPSGPELSREAIYAQNVDSIVEVSCEILVNYGFFGTGTSEVFGTGFVIDGSGYIMTNYHVVADSYNIYVTTHNGDEYVAEVVGVSEAHDIAVLKIDATGLKPVKIGSSASAEVGNTVYTIGHPLGLQYSMSTGMISAVDRMIYDSSETAISVIQIDCGINEGNSGGPLFNSRGEVIGVTNAKYAGTTIESIGFAIPIDFAMNDYYQIVEYGEVTNKAYLGITYVIVDENNAMLFHLVPGAFVHSVEPGSCAEKAGLQVKDIITKINNQPLTDISTVSGIMANFLPGDEITLTVDRDGETLILKVILDARPTDEEPVQQYVQEPLG